MSLATETVADVVGRVLGPDLPIAVRAYDGSELVPSSQSPPAATVVIRSPDALRRIITSPGELGVARAYVAGDLDVEGDLLAVLDLRDRLPTVHLPPGELLRLTRTLGISRLKPLAPPEEEARLHGRRHSPARDAAAIAHHYDVSNEFYRLVLGPSLTYSCALFTDASETLEVAQANKHELISAKLDLGPGSRLLDVGCGWGSMAMHAAIRHGSSVVGVTNSAAQADLAGRRVVEAGLSGRVEIRLQDYREVDDGPYDAISSIGMFEHVGEAKLAEYFGRLHELLRPGGRLLNHGIGRPPRPEEGGWTSTTPLIRPRRRSRARLPHHSFLDRYVFPDGELHEVGRVISVVQRAGFEVRHVETLREHYGLTLRRWLANLEANWDEAVAEVGGPRARVWRLYIAGAARNFDANRNQVHQILAVRPDGDRSGMPLRPSWIG